MKTSSWATNCGKWVSNSHTLYAKHDQCWEFAICGLLSENPAYPIIWKSWINTRELPLTLLQSKIQSNQSWTHVEWNAIFDIAMFSIYYPYYMSSIVYHIQYLALAVASNTYFLPLIQLKYSSDGLKTAWSDNIW